MPDFKPNIKQLVAQGESSAVEFKLRLPSGNVIASTLAALANSSGGVLLIGVDDKGEVVGLADDEADRALVELRRVASSLLPYPADIGSRVVDGKTVVYTCIDRAPDHLSPILTADGSFFTRRGSTSRRLNSAEEQTTLRRTPSAPRATDRRCHVFVAMSFRTEEEPALEDYYRAIERACARLSLPIDLHRIDLEEGDYEISQRIMDSIDRCDIVIADFTLTPPNVYFELGYARGSSKQIIQTARQGTPLEFDVRNWRTEFYRNATELEERIGLALEAAYASVTGQA